MCTLTVISGSLAIVFMPHSQLCRGGSVTLLLISFGLTLIRLLDLPLAVLQILSKFARTLVGDTHPRFGSLLFLVNLGKIPAGFYFFSAT